MRLFEIQSVRLDENFIEIKKLILSESEMDHVTVDLAVRSAYSALKSTFELLDDALKYRDPSQVMPAMGPLYKWVMQNFDTSKVSGTGYGLKTVLLNLRDSNPKLKPLIQELLSSLPDIADRTNNQRVGAEKKFFILIAGLTQLAKKMNPAFKDPGVAQLSDQVSNTLKSLRSIKSSDSGIEPLSRTAVTTKKDNVVGQQAAQAELVVNQVLSGLPKDIAAGIRSRIAKSDNKLLALKQEMSKITQ